MAKKAKIAIIGLGLIGGSIFKSLDKRKYEVIAVSKSQKGKNIYQNYDKLKNLDLVFVCSKMSDTQGILDNLNDILDKKTIVSDVCSIKKCIKDKDYNFNFIMSHPMAGTEKSGYKASFKGLFKGAKWVVSKNNPLLNKVIRELGAKPILMDKNTHDASAAMVSHMPNILAAALFYSIQSNNSAKLLASSGFRDMTRLVLSDSYLLSDMLEYNEKNINLSLNELEKSLNKIKKLSYNERVNLFKELSSKREKMYKNGKNQTT